MASIYALKAQFQTVLRPLVNWLQSIGATANQVTLAAAVASLLVTAVVLGAAVEHPMLFLLLPAWMLVRMALNAVDGMLAREHGQQSHLGAYLNELCDVVSDVALYLALLAVPGMSAAPVLLFAGLAVLTEYAGVLGVMVGASRRYEGPMGKSDRAFLMGALGLLLAVGWILAPAVGWALYAASALCVLTVWRRVSAGLATASPAKG